MTEYAIPLLFFLFLFFVLPLVVVIAMTIERHRHRALRRQGFPVLSQGTAQLPHQE